MPPVVIVRQHNGVPEGWIFHLVEKFWRDEVWKRSVAPGGNMTETGEVLMRFSISGQLSGKSENSSLDLMRQVTRGDRRQDLRIGVTPVVKVFLQALFSEWSF